MFKKKIIIVIMLSFLLTLPLAIVNAQSIDISLNQQTFRPGDEIRAKASFTNPESQHLSGHIICNFISLSPGLPPSSFMEKLDLSAGQKSKTFTFSMTVSEWMPEGLYRAEIEIQDEKETMIAKNHRDFKVIGTKRNIDAEVNICKDKECSERNAVFVIGETVYLKLDTFITDFDIDTVLTTPDNEIRHLTFKNNLASFKADEAGSFSIAISISKEGYLVHKIDKSIAVIKAPVEIESASVCDADGNCENNENPTNCPQDCPSGIKDDYCDRIIDSICDPDCSSSEDIDCRKKSTKTYLYYIITILILILISVIAYIIYKKTNEKKKWKELEKKCMKKTDIIDKNTRTFNKAITQTPAFCHGYT